MPRLEVGRCVGYFCISNLLTMNTKLTLTLDDAAVASAKKYARQSGKSLSELVEGYFVSLTTREKRQAHVPPNIMKLMGVITLPADFDHKKELGKMFRQKHGK